MFKFLVFLFLFFLLLVSLLGFSALRTFKAILFGSPKKRTRAHSSTSADRQRARESRSRPSRKKMIAKEEGEYIDYEEVKD
ncbi:MAG: DUF4834 family protein [Tannerella sp.]|jgi:hypothetical protein|nr:DUF4834 family protein [Tannerella sp.]